MKLDAEQWRELGRGGVLTVPEEAVEGSEPIREARGMNGPITVLRAEGTWLVREPDPEGRTLLRRFDTEREAVAFLEERLSQFERMWDGCGCRIDYGSHEAATR